MGFEGRVVVVTGASSGIGRATVQRFASLGARVVAFARTGEALARLAETAVSNILPVAGDVAEESDIERLFSETEAKLGPCEVLVNNAGTYDPALVTDLTTAGWDRVFAVNTRAVFLTCRRALPGMIARRSGSIVNVASISGVHGSSKFPKMSAYCASKSAVIALTEAVAAEVREHGVRVNCISPGSVDTPMLARAAPHVKPDMTPEEIAAVIEFLAGEASRPINGQNVHAFSS